MPIPVDWNRIIEEVESAVNIACGLAKVPYDDEFVSVGYRKAMYAVEHYAEEKTEYDIYGFVRFAVIRCIKLYIRLKYIRESRLQSLQIATDYGHILSGTIDLAEDRLDPEGSAMLKEFAEREPDIAKMIEETGRVTGGREQKSRKTWQIARMRKDRLKKEQDSEQ